MRRALQFVSRRLTPESELPLPRASSKKRKGGPTAALLRLCLEYKKASFVVVGLLLYLLILLLTGAPLAAEESDGRVPVAATHQDTTLPDEKDENTHGGTGEERQEEEDTTKSLKEATAEDFVPFKLFPRDEEVLNGVRQPRPPTQEQLTYWAAHPPPPYANQSNYTRVYEMIMQHQFPASCQGKKFLTWTIGASGAGSDMHISSFGLALAMATNRIFIYNPSQTWRWADAEFCESHRLPSCYFLPVTNCTLPHGVTPVSAQGRAIPDEPEVVAFHQDHSYYHMWHLPPVLETLSHQVPWEPERISNWRAVSTSFLWRPNPRFSQLVKTVFKRIFGGDGTPPQRSFAMHVRHGDMYLEMKLHPFSDYMEEAERLKKVHPYLGKSDVVLLSTEDPTVIQEAEAWNAAHPNGTQWQFVYLNDPKSNNHYAAPMPRWHFVSAFVLSTADAYILTTGSNWCRVINEMRKTHGKYLYAFTDLQHGEW